MTMVLHATTAEVQIWQQRRTSGPYLDDWNRLLARAQTFRTTPSSDTWPGNQLNELWDPVAVTADNQPPNFHPRRRLGDGLRDAGFVYLVTGDTTYRDAVRTALLTQAGLAGTDFGNTARWNNASTVLDFDNFQIPNWLRKLAYGYGYIRSSLSSGDRTTLDAWFLTSATYWDTILDNQIKGRFPDRHDDDYNTPQPSHNPGRVRGPTHGDGYTVYSFHGCWENIPATTNAMVAVVGALLNNATLKDHAKRFVKEWLMFAVAPDGTVVDQYRWNTTNTNPAQLGYNYAGTVLGSIVVAVDHLARAGDTELYDYTTSAGFFGWEGGPKSLLLALRRYAQMTLGERGLPNGILVSARDDRSESVAERIGPGTTHANDIWLIPANLYYQDALLKQAYTRVLPSNPASGGYDPWSGDWGTYPGIRFMFGLQEGVVYPYPVTAPDVTSNLRMHPKFDEGTGTTAEDSTANNHDGTLETGATWGAAKLGASAVALDGTTEGVVTVTGGLTNPTSATLAAWVFPTAWPATNNEVINLRNGIILRMLNSGSVRGSFFNGTTYTGMTVEAGLALNTWHHLAYTVTPEAQRLYVNGTLVGTSNDGATVSYSGLPANTLIGSHPTNPTNFRFQGRIDDARVYTRALSATDIAALAALADPPP